MTFVKSIDGWDRSGKSSLMCLSWPLQQVPHPCMRPFFPCFRVQVLAIYSGTGYRTTLLASSVWTRTVFSNLYTPSTGPIYFTRCEASKNVFFSPADPKCGECGRLTLVVDPVPFVRGWDSANGRGLELHKWSASSTRKTIHGHHLLSKPCDM
jgi:hypothetical protein